MNKVKSCFSLLLLLAIFACGNKENIVSEKEAKPKIEKSIESQKQVIDDESIPSEDLWENWNPKIEAYFRQNLKKSMIKKGIKEEDASKFAECSITKMKEQNLMPKAVRDYKNSMEILSISVSCSQEIEKK
ncbi:hypothetical protein [Flavobacterium ginsenosidimutans]|uniref:Lipoprotein n=1 Tax=Flavobacterium ginsenosidimutans TaxID=687844 RepID=A0ABZ2QFL5_9FLAO|nr:hypothetical protein [Flavobacterium ginsenosidimutans]KAF2332240.1 hypothetical protein DM444_09765 [Flavobacterium ginsenosidimutans]